MAEWYGTLETVVSLTMVAFAVLLCWRGRRAPTTYILAVWLFLLGGYHFLMGFGGRLGLSPFDQVYLMGMLASPRPFLVAAFGLVYLRPVLSVPVRVALGLLALGAAAYAASGIIEPGIYFTPEPRVTPFGANLFLTLSLSSFVVAVGSIGLRWLRSSARDYRTQSLWGLLPFLFWTIHDTLGFVVFPLLLGAQESSFAHHVRQIPAAHVVVVGAVGLLIALGLVVVAARRMSQGTGNKDAKVLFLIALYSVPISILQLFDPAYHSPVDTLIMPLLAYGVMRHQVVDVDLRLRWTLRRGTVAGFLVAVFFVVSEAAAEMFTVDAGLNRWLGILAAGLLLFALSPLQRLADRFTDAALPHTRDADRHLDSRKEEIYRVAAQELLADGALTPKELVALTRLRAHLELDAQRAGAIEQDIARAFAPDPAPSPTS